MANYLRNSKKQIEYMQPKRNQATALTDEQAMRQGLSNSLGQVANLGGGMRSADAYGTYKQAQDLADYARDRASAAKLEFQRSSGVNYGGYKKWKDEERWARQTQADADKLSKYAGIAPVTNTGLQQAVGQVGTLLGNVGGLRSSDKLGTYQMQLQDLENQKNNLIANPISAPQSDDVPTMNEYYRARNQYWNEMDDLNNDISNLKQKVTSAKVQNSIKNTVNDSVARLKQAYQKFLDNQKNKKNVVAKKNAVTSKK